MANVHWGPGPTPYGAELTGGYPDSTGAAELLKLNSGQYAGGNGWNVFHDRSKTNCLRLAYLCLYGYNS